MNSALAKRQEQLQDTLRNELRKEKIQFTAIKNSDKFGTTVTLENADQNVKSSAYYSSVTPNIRSV